MKCQLKIAICLFLACVSLLTYADKVSTNLAVSVAEVWRNENTNPLTVKLFGEPQLKEVCTNDVGEALFYVIQYSRGGYIWLSADTAAGPVLAIGSGRAPSLYEGSGEAAKILAEENVTKMVECSFIPTLRSTSNSYVRTPQERWSKLRAKAIGGRTLLFSAYENIQEVRRAPFIKSKWKQGEVGRTYFNSCTPHNAVAGCIPVAGAQVVRYYQYPSQISAFTNMCKYNGSYTNLSVKAHTFNWNLMPYNPTPSFIDEQAQESGFLMYAIGVACGAEFRKKITSSSLPKLKQAFESFGYKSVLHKEQINGLQLSTVLPIILPCLDAYSPVICGILGPSGGHAAIADGYGYQDGDLYIHLNFGWGGDSDMWYQLPNLQTTDYTFNKLTGILYNIIPGEETSYFVSGRVFSKDGTPLSNVEVVAKKEQETFTSRTDEQGIYSFKFPTSTQSGKFTVTPSYDSGKGVASIFSYVSGANAGGYNLTFSFGFGVDVNKEMNLGECKIKEEVFSVPFQGIAGRTYFGERSDDLVVWTKELTKVAESSGEMVFDFVKVPNKTREFFRVTRKTEEKKEDVIEIAPPVETFVWQQTSSVNNEPSSWLPVADEAYEGGSAMKLVIPAIRTERVVMSTSVKGPLRVSFQYKYCLAHSKFALLVDDNEVYSQTDDDYERNWISTFYEIPDGEHTLSFVCDKSNWYYDGFDNGVTIDNLKFDKTFTPAPSILPVSTILEATACTFTNEQTITILEPADCIVYYTLDSTTPTEDTGFLYTGPFTIKKSSFIQAIAVKEGKPSSYVVQALYRKVEEVEAGKWNQDAQKVFEKAAEDGQLVLLVEKSIGDCYYSRLFQTLTRESEFATWAKNNKIYLIDEDASLYPDIKKSKEMFWKKYYELSQATWADYPMIVFCKGNGEPVAYFCARPDNLFSNPLNGRSQVYNGTASSLISIIQDIINAIKK